MDANEKVEGFAGLLWTVITQGGFRAFIFLVSLLFVFFYVEKHTRIIYYYSLEHRIYAIKQIKEISKNKAVTAEVEKIQVELLNELNKRKVEPMEFPVITTDILYKFLTGACFGLLFLIIGFIYKRPRAMQGALLVALFFGAIAVFIPIIGSIWINLLILVAVQLTLFISTPQKDPPTRPRSA